MRIGYFGGTFDPPHRAHLVLARAAADAFALDHVLLVPTGLQPLKQYAPAAGYEDRLAMTRLLCAKDVRLEASDRDAPHPDGSPNYTVDALGPLRAEHPTDSLFVILGADSFLTLPQWHKSSQLLQLAEWIVVSRPGVSLDDLSALQLSTEQASRVHRLMSVDDETSASGIRERLRIGVSCGSMLTPSVALYIARMNLYHAR